MNHTLLLRLKDARYKVLVACRPLAPARYAFNVALQALIDSDGLCFNDEMVEAIKSLMLQE